MGQPPIKAPVRRPTGALGALPQPRRDTQPGGVAVRGASPKLNEVQGRAPAPVAVGPVQSALDTLAAGEGATYKALLYLHRAATTDLTSVLQATHSPDPSLRWKRLWAASGFVARGMRAKPGHQAVVGQFQRDLGLAHFFTLFVKRRNPAAKRVLERAREGFLGFMLQQVAGSRAHPRKLALLVGIVEHLESRPEVLRAAVVHTLGEAAVDDLLPHLVQREDPRRAAAGSRRLSQNLQGQLEALRKLHGQGDQHG